MLIYVEEVAVVGEVEFVFWVVVVEAALLANIALLRPHTLRRIGKRRRIRAMRADAALHSSPAAAWPRLE